MKNIAGASSVGLITNQNNSTDNFKSLDPEFMAGVKELFEDKINEIQNVLKDGGKVAFSNNGYGNQTLMPEELFVYLSKRLFEEFGYLNPGSELMPEISKQIAAVQDITDAEIMTKFGNENNPLSC